MSTPVQEGLWGPDGLTGGECARCGRRHFPEAARCPWCGAAGTTAVTLGRTGTLWAWTAVTAAPPGYEGEVPYGFGVVELQPDGLRIVSRLTESDPARLRAGMPVRWTTVALTPATMTWAFAPA